jgi:hypothetical protein
MPSVPPGRHREFFDVLRDADARGAWRTLPTAGAPLRELILADDFDPVARRGSRTRLVRWPPGALLPEAVVHDFHEEVFVVDGEFVVGCDARGEGGETFGPYTYACRPPGVVHGPFASRTGCTLLEFMYY